ncbi:MAG: FABP family protein [Myxococcaceae bacterium]|nr:FABP family protein [Myxococcaceae bacterium]
MSKRPLDIYTEPEDFDLDTLKNLGPLTALAGIWEGEGVDRHPVAEGGEDEPYLERMEFQPIDPQLNGPQLLYGLRYHVHVKKLTEPLTFHDQIGYWLWEPATKVLLQTVAIPRGQVALARGIAEPGAKSFTVRATLGAECFGICSATFLQKHFLTRSYTQTLTFDSPRVLTYEQDTVLETPGRKPFHHTDRATLEKVGEPTPNPAAPKKVKGRTKRNVTV